MQRMPPPSPTAPRVASFLLLVAAAAAAAVAAVDARSHASASHRAGGHAAEAEGRPLPAGSLPGTAESWDAPVISIEREESLPSGSVPRRPMDDDGRTVQHMHDGDREQIERNRVDDVPGPGKTTTTPAPSSASRTSSAGAVAFTVALLLLLEM